MSDTKNETRRYLWCDIDQAQQSGASEADEQFVLATDYDTLQRAHALALSQLTGAQKTAAELRQQLERAARAIENLGGNCAQEFRDAALASAEQEKRNE